MRRAGLLAYLLLSPLLFFGLGAVFHRQGIWPFGRGHPAWMELEYALELLDTMAGYHAVEALFLVALTALALLVRGRWATPLGLLAAIYGICLGLWLAIAQLDGPGLHTITYRGVLDGEIGLTRGIAIVAGFVLLGTAAMAAARRVGFDMHGRGRGGRVMYGALLASALGVFALGWYLSSWHDVLSALYASHRAEPKINELMASNGRTRSDDDGYFEDWLEIHNPGNRAIDLGGWGLTDDPDRPFKWMFPRGAVIPENGHLLVWASRQDRIDPKRPLHTNFALDRDGEAVVLTSPLGREFDRSDAVAMHRDVSVGRPGDRGTSRAPFSVPTPGSPNVGYTGYLADASVSFSPASTTFTGILEVALDGARDGETIHYTIDGSEPTQASPVYSAPLAITAATTLKTRIFNTEGAGSRSTEQRYLEISEELSARRSNLPMVVIDTLGHSLTKTVTPRGKRRYPGYIFTFDTDNDGVSVLARQPDLAVPQGGRYRGTSTLRWPKKPYSVQFRDALNRSEARPLLGMPAHRNWAFYPGYIVDHTFMRNAFAYELSRAAGRYAPRTRFVELFVNNDNNVLDPEHYAGVYDVMETLDFGGDRIPGRAVDDSDVPPPGKIDINAPGPWTGGYIVKLDYVDSDEFAWSTKLRQLHTNPASGVTLETPKLRNLDGGPYRDRAGAGKHSAQVRYIKTWYEAFEDALIRDHDSGFTSRDYRDFIDMKTWVDHLLINLFTKNRDSLTLSTHYVKHRNGRMSAGPVWDFDRSMGSGDARWQYSNTWDAYEDLPPLFRRHWWKLLVADPDFAQAYYDRYAALRQTEFADERLAARIQRMADELDAADSALGSAMARDTERWPVRYHQKGSFRDEVRRLREWVISHARWLDRRDFNGGRLPAPPTITRDMHDGDRMIRISGDPGNAVYYTLDGTDPRGTDGTYAGRRYTGPIIAAVGSTVIARAVTAGDQWSTPSRMTVETE
ncbi:MAG: CotH kinase family protein [Gammaproteobacteria bacterium]|nr:CotH kinase family protein [Gammaproteobacteria bacterium]